MQELVMLMIFARQSSCLMISFKWCQVSLLGPSEDKSLYLLIACLNSSLEKELQQEVDFHLILLRILVSTWWLRALLKILWSASHRLSRERHEQPSYLIALIAGSLHLLIQFISSQGPQLLLATSWIFESKKDLLVFLTVFLKFFQLSRLLDGL